MNRRANTRKFKKLIGFITVFLLLHVQSSGQLNLQLEDTLNSRFSYEVNRLGLKGAAAAIVFPDGTMWKTAEGKYGSKALSPELLYEAGSNTKTFVASIILQMADKGLLALDDTFGKFLDPGKFVDGSVTIRQLLNHTSGIYDFTQNPDYYNEINTNYYRVWTPEEVLSTFMKDMVFEPGEKWQYCNTNYLLLGLIIEEIDGIPFRQSLRNRLLQPHELEDTYLAVFEDYPLTKTGSWLIGGSYFDVDFDAFLSSAWAAGALLATPGDLARWAHQLYSGEVLPGSWLDTMRITRDIGSGFRYGLGLLQRDYRGRTYIGHGGTTLQHSEMEYSVSSGFSCVSIVIEQGKAAHVKLIQNALIDVVENLLPALSIGEVTEPQFHVFPNPAESHVTIRMNDNIMHGHPLTARILSIDGRVQNMIEDFSGYFKRNGLPSGMYLLEIINSNGRYIGSRIVYFR